MKKIVVFGLLISFLISCSVLHVEKRRYRKGFHVSWNKKNKTSEDEKIEDVASKNEVEVKASQSVVKESSKTESLGNKIKISEGDFESSKDEVIPKSRSSKFSRRPGSVEKISVEHEEVSEFETETELDTQENKKSSALYYFFLLGLVPVIAFQKNRGYKVSKWASENKMKAQGLIVVSSLVAVASSYLLGNILQWETSTAMLIAPVLIMASSALIYHKNKKKGNLFKNRMAYSMFNVGVTFGAFYAGASGQALLNSPGVTEDPMIMNPFWGLLLALVVLAALAGALMLVAVASCSLACNNLVILAVLVLFLGGFLSIFLGILALKGIFRRESQVGEKFAGKAALLALITMLVLAALLLVPIFI